MSNTTNWASRTKAALTSVSNTTVAADGFEAVGAGGNFEKIIAYYQFNAPKKAGGIARQLQAGSEVTGTYEGSFTGKTYGNTVHKVRTSEGLVGIPGSGQLDKLLSSVANGNIVKIVYNGKSAIKEGKFAGKLAHNFAVAQKKA